MSLFNRYRKLGTEQVDEILDRVPDLKIEFQTRMNGEVLRTFDKKSEAEAFMQGVFASRRSISTQARFKILQLNNGEVSRRWEYVPTWKMVEEIG